MSQQQPASKRTSRVPIFTSREEEAAWWDSHDLADYQDEFETVKGRFAEKLSEEDASQAAHSAPERT
jgi:hypothetical protein